MVFPYQEGLVLLIGASDLNGQGKIVVYFSKDRNVHNFHQLGELTFTDQELGYMVECPNLVFIDGQPVLLFCPQGLSPSVKVIRISIRICTHWPKRLIWRIFL